MIGSRSKSGIWKYVLTLAAIISVTVTPTSIIFDMPIENIFCVLCDAAWNSYYEKWPNSAYSKLLHWAMAKNWEGCSEFLKNLVEHVSGCTYHFLTEWDINIFRRLTFKSPKYKIWWTSVKLKSSRRPLRGAFCRRQNALEGKTLRSPRKNFRSSTTNSFRDIWRWSFTCKNPAALHPEPLVPIKTISLIFKIMMNYNPRWRFSEFPKSSVAVMNARKFMRFHEIAVLG